MEKKETSPSIRNKIFWITTASERFLIDLVHASKNPNLALILSLHTSDHQQILVTNHLYELYGNLSKDYLLQGVNKIERRLGGALAKEAITAINAGELRQAVEITLKYYDKSYEYGLAKREQSSIKRVVYDGKSVPM